MDEFPIEKYKYQQQIIRETAEQLKKDFGMYALEITFSGNDSTAYDELFNQVLPVVRDLYFNQPSKLSSLLYQIDIPESDLQNIYSRPVSELFDMLTEYILKRELLKVVIRHHYKNGWE